MDEETWKNIPGYPGYEASNLGRIRGSVNRWGSNYPVKIRKQNTISNGRVYVSVAGTRRQVSRLVAMAFLPNPEKKLEVNHIDGKPANNNLSNLEWCTPSENQKHAYRLGLKSQTGSKNSRAKLTEDQVREILKSPIRSASEISKKYHIKYDSAWNIMHGQGWKSLRAELEGDE